MTTFDIIDAAIESGLHANELQQLLDRVGVDDSIESTQDAAREIEPTLDFSAACDE